MARRDPRHQRICRRIVAATVLLVSLAPLLGFAQTFPNPLVNTATVTVPGNAADPAPGNNTAADSNVLAAVSQLSVTKTLTTASPVPVGGAVGYQIVVSNAGPSDAVGVLVADPVPPQLSGVTWTCAASTPASSCATPSGTGDISVIVTVAVGDTITFTLSGTAPTVTPATIAANTVTLTPPPGTTDPTPGDDTSTVPPVPVVPLPLVANDDAGAIVLGTTGGIAVANVRGNDTLNGVGATAADTVLTVTVPPATPNITVNPTTGEVVVAASTPAGNYSLTYQLCETANPGNCDTAIVTVPVSAPVIDAVDDAVGPVPGSGGTGVINVLTNDTIGGSPVVPANVVLTPTNAGPVTINPDGSVDVAPNTPAGPYVATYQICEVLNPSNCDGATVTITVAAGAIAAVDDDASATPISGSAGGTAIASVLANDSLNAVPPTSATVVLTVTVPPSNPNVVLNLVSGAVTVAANTPAGSYPLTYQICEQLNPANCATAVATVAVAAAAIAANDDDASATPVNGAAGGTAVANVLANDSLDGAVPTPANVTLSLSVPPSSPNIALNLATGAVTVAPNTPAGSYSLTYQICEQLNPANCDTAVITVAVAAAAIAANDDDASATPVLGTTGGIAVPNVLANDTLDGAAPTLATVVLTQTVAPTHPGVVLNTGSGTVTVAAATPAGTYTLTYQICEQLNPTNCDTAIVTVVVAASALNAIDDTAGPINGLPGATAVVNVLGNDTFNGTPATAANVSLAPVVAGPLTILANGNVDVAPNTPAGSYSAAYTICDLVDAGNCDSATVTVNVVAATIDAVNDDFSATPVSGTAGGTTPSLLGNDTLNGAPFAPAAVVLTPGATPPGITVNPDGTVTIAPNTPAATVTISYQICEVLNPANCDSATATITVSAAIIDAVDDDFSAAPINGSSGGTTPSVLANDSLNGAPATLANIILTNGATPPGITVNANGTITVAANTAAGTATISYQICEQLNPANCDGATATIVVAAAAIDAVNDDFSATPVNGASGGTTPSLLGNDTLNGAAFAPAAVVLTPGPTPAGITVNPDGTVTIAPNTPAATVTISYQICEVLNPTNCDSATATLTVSAAIIDAVNDDFSATPVNGATGGTTASLLANDTLDGAPATTTTVVLTPGAAPTGITVNANGTIAVAPNTPAGTVSISYQICEVLNPTNCDGANATLVIAAAAIDAVDDSGAPVNGLAGGVAIADVRSNDQLNGALPTGANSVLTIATPSTNPGVVLNLGTGAVTVAAGTPAGSYSLTYRLCEQLNPANCDTAVVTVAVAAAVIDAVNDDFSAAPIPGASGGTTASVLANDTLNGVLVTPAAIVLTPGPTPAGIAVNTDGTVTVAPNTPAATVTITYQICEVLNPANCDSATATLVILAAQIDAADDTGTPVNGSTGGTAVPNVLVNDTVAGGPATIANISLSQVSSTSPQVTLDVATGAVQVAPGTPAGAYSLVYQICEKLNPANCDSATVVVTVQAAVIDAVDDTAGPISGATGGTAVINVLGNDTFNGAAINPTDIVLTPTSSGPLSISANGALNVAAGTAAGTYSIPYQICDQLNPGNCDTATATVTVVAGAIVANADTAVTPQNAPVTTPVLVNDTLGGQPVVAVNVVVTITTPATTGTAVANADGTTTYNPPLNFSGTDSYGYTVCEVLNPSNCASATVTVTVQPNVVAANDDTVQTTKTDPVVIPVLVNDTVTGAPWNIGSLTIQGGPANGTATCTLGSCTYTANDGFTGTDSFTYQICDTSTPTPVCDTAMVTIAVAGDVVTLRLTKRAAQTTAHIGDLVRYTVIVDNVGNTPAVNASLVDTLPPGFSYVDGSLVVMDDNQGGSLGSINPLRIDGIDLAVGGQATISYSLRVGAGAGMGTHTNRVIGRDFDGNELSNIASADVEVVGDPLLDDSLIVGSVFDDRNGDGIQAANERGIPGVRVNSVEGLVIETDSYGRFHLIGIDGGGARGRNFILKVDITTLPPGASFTTENPRVRRITPGLPVRFDFGVHVPDTELGGGQGLAAAVELGDVMFEGASAVVREPYLPVLDRIAAALSEHGGGRVTIAARADAEDLAFERAESIQKLLMSRLDPAIAAKVGVDITGAVDPTQRLLSLDHAIGLTGVLFDTDRATIRPEFKPLIHRIAVAIEAQGYGELEIVGHADARGSIEHNRQLGLKRAKAVFTALSAELSPAVRKRLRVEVRPPSHVTVTTEAPR